jgi:prepilin-type N-terminal cleavage/methylation domain-containing protein
MRDLSARTSGGVAPGGRGPFDALRAGRAGLTLIEVLLAVSILGVAFTALLTGASRCLAAIRKAKYYQDAQWTLAMGEADHPMLETNDVESLNVSAETYDNGLVYTREVEDDEDEDGLYLVRARVMWTDKGHEAYEEVVSYIYQPEEDE